jgi:hypothetical protein
MSTIPLPRPDAGRSRRWLALALALFLAALSVKYAFKALDNRSAIQRWRPQLLNMEQGVDISAEHNYPNPPVMAVLLEPLTWLPPLAAALTWFYLKAGLALLALHWVFALVEDAEHPFPTWARALTALLALKPVADDLGHGNVNLFILFLIVAALTAWRRRRDTLAGLLLGLAVACKVTPALFLPYLAWKRAWRALTGCAAGLVLFLWPGVVPALRLGHAANQQQLRSWYGVMVRPFLFEGQVTSEHKNQSLPGVVARLATHRASFHTYVGITYTPTRYDNFLDLSPEAGRAAVQGCMALFALLIVWACRTPAEPRHGWRLGAEFGLVLLGMLLFSERTWKHHAVVLVLPLAVVCHHLAACRPSARLRAFLVGCLTAVVLLLFSTGLGAGHEGPGDHAPVTLPFAKAAQVYGAYTLAFAVLVAALAVLLRRGDVLAPDPSPPGEGTSATPLGPGGGPLTPCPLRS